MTCDDCGKTGFPVQWVSIPERVGETRPLCRDCERERWRRLLRREAVEHLVTLVLALLCLLAVLAAALLTRKP